jgi:hypothetical protein
MDLKFLPTDCFLLAKMKKTKVKTFFVLLGFEPRVYMLAGQVLYHLTHFDNPVL